MRNYTTFLFLMIGLARFSAVQAQKRFRPGYLVLQRGDTVRGVLEAPTRNTVARGVILRKSDKPTDEVFYPVKEIRSLRFTEGKTYVVRKMLPVMLHDTLRLLLEPLVQGNANLYRSGYSLYSNGTDEVFANQFSLIYYYIESSANLNRPPYLLQTNTFRQALGMLFSNCSTAPAVTGKFNEANLIRLVRQYNTCTTPVPR